MGEHGRSGFPGFLRDRETKASTEVTRLLQRLGQGDCDGPQMEYVKTATRPCRDVLVYSTSGWGRGPGKGWSVSLQADTPAR